MLWQEPTGAEHRNEVSMKKQYGGKRKSQHDDTSISRRRLVGPRGEMRFMAV
jgi:hypothetical protein